MFLSKDYILANEITEKCNIHIANVSMLIKELEDRGNVSDYKRLGNCTFLKRNSLDFNYIQNCINKHEFTDISNKVPLSYLLREFSVTKKALYEYLSDIITGEEVIGSKTFVVFDRKFVEQLKGYTITDIHVDELPEVQSDIVGFKQVSKKKCLVWY